MTKSIAAAILASVGIAVTPSIGECQNAPRPVETPRTVTLSLNEYNRLVDLANRPPDRNAPAPVASVVAGADLKVRVDRDTVRGVFNLTGEVLRAGVSRVALLSSTTLVDANAAGRPVPVISDNAGQAALLAGPGPFALTLDWGAPLTVTPGRAAFVLPVPAAATARATFDLPGEQADVHLSAGLVTHRSIANGRTTVEATLTPGAATEVSWSMRDASPVAAAKEARTLADVLTLVTVGDSDVRMVGAVDLTVVQGEPKSFEVAVPAGYEIVGVTGSSLESSERRDGTVLLTVADPAVRRHQFLISLERPHDAGSFSLDTGFLAVTDVQRERGEIAIEGVGTLELTAPEKDGMHRIDVRELNPTLQTLSRQPILAAFRYQRSAAAPPSLALDVRRFPDAGVLAAIGERATATTLVTSEGRALTEVSLLLRNRAQPFLKVTLPPGASIVSVDVAGEPAKPVLGADGTRVPLLRPGFRPQSFYTVSFVYVHAGAPFAKKGVMEMALPRMDIPIGVVEWEVFAPDRYSLKTVGGNVIDRDTFGVLVDNDESGVPGGVIGGVVGGVSGGIVGGMPKPAIGIQQGQIAGRIVDAQGASLPGVVVDVEGSGGRQRATTGADGSFVISDVPSGSITVTAHLQGFQPQKQSVAFDQQPMRLDFAMPVAAAGESIAVTAAMPGSGSGSGSGVAAGGGSGGGAFKASPPAPAPPSQNVIDLQRRAAGVLPIRIDVPRAGTSHQFVKTLVVDETAVVTFQYKTR